MQTGRTPRKASPQKRWRKIAFFARQLTTPTRITQLAVLMFFVLLLPGRSAEIPGTKPASAPTSTTTGDEDPLGRDSPYNCVAGFLKHANRGDYARAAEYLDLQTTPAQAHELARQLDVVVESYT
jgi:hypothetical protein